MRALDFGAPPALSSGSAGVAAASWLLRLAILGYAVGIVSAVQRKLGSGLGTYFFLEWGFTHPQVAPVERLVAWLLMALAVATLIRPHWSLALPITSLVFLEAAAQYFNAGFPFSQWTLLAHALRYGAPAALAVLYLGLLSRGLGLEKHLAMMGWLLRAALATVFTVHGVEALMRHPRFIDYIIGTTYNFTGHFLAEAAAIQIMRVIGVVDILVAVLVLVRPRPAVLYWMAFWGLITALARVTTLGLGHHHEVFVRSAHFLAPLAVLCILGAIQHGRGGRVHAPGASS